MKNLRIFLVLCLMVLTLSCYSVYHVTYAYDREADFMRLKTYDWLPIQSAAELDRDDERRIENAVNTQLEARGYKMTSQNPDFLIATNVGSPKMPYRTTRLFKYGYEEVTLVLYFRDVKSNEIIWVGGAKADFNPNYTPEERDKLANEAASKILKNFPPPP